MFTIIHEYHQLLRKGGLKAAPDKTHFFLRKVKFLGHVISQDGIQPVAKRVQDLKNTILAVPSTDYPFHIHVDSSNVGTGCILLQQFPEGKGIVSFNSRVFDKAEQKCLPSTENFAVYDL